MWHEYLHLAGTDFLIFGYLRYTGLPLLFYAFEREPLEATSVATRACYLPLNTITAQVLGGQVDAYPQFADPLLHAAVNAGIIALIFAYASASLARHLRAGNLTHRGIVARGPLQSVASSTGY